MIKISHLNLFCFLNQLLLQQTLQQPQQQNQQVIMNDDQQMIGNAQQGNQPQQSQGPGGPSGPQQRPQPVSLLYRFSFHSKRLCSHILTKSKLKQSAKGNSFEWK